ncbi:MAG TPA: sulfurtransferase TusA family protein [Actinotalea sp.]|nr:sulfurtransferase TusA family protein [Actinotalea sp.]
MSSTDPVERVLVDARGLRCPIPVVRAAQATRDSPPGTLLVVRWTDPAARHDLPAWARMRGHLVVGTKPDDPGWVTTIRIG